MTKPHQPWFIRKPTPEKVQKIHILGLAGSGMGAFGCMLKEAGYEVRGSDRAAYPPMSDILAEREIPLSLGWDPSHLDWDPDWVIIGNVCRSDNPLVLAAEEKGLPSVSFPQAISDLFLAQRRPVVIAGTHGKTTTTTLTAWLLTATDHIISSQEETGLLVGGQGGNFKGPFHIGSEGSPFVIEGDEYDTAFFDKGPKFLHYRPEVALLNNVEFDHADIYDSIEEIEENFERLCDLITEGKTLWVNRDDQRAMRCAQRVTGQVITYGFAPEASWRATHVNPHQAGCDFTLHLPSGETFNVCSPLAGRHNVWNTIAALGMAHTHFQRPIPELLRALQSFRGVQKRQEELGEADGVLVMDDYAHHPTAIRETIDALIARYPERRLWAIYEPKSNTARRNIHQEEYASAFKAAPVVRLARPFKKEDHFSEDERLDLDQIISQLEAQGVDAKTAPEIDGLVSELIEIAQPGDLLVFMSSSSFEGAQRKVLEGLRARAPQRSKSDSTINPQSISEEVGKTADEDKGAKEDESGGEGGDDPYPPTGYPPSNGSAEAYAAQRSLRRARRYQSLSARLDQKIGWIAGVRFFAFITGLISLFSAWYDQTWGIYAWGAGIGCSLFLVTVWLHRKLYALLPRANAQAELAKESAARLNHEWVYLKEDGSRFSRGTPEERELQIFGEVSLFKLLNRAHLRGAQLRLAELLSASSDPERKLDLEELASRSNGAQELAGLHGLRRHFMGATRLSRPKGGARGQAIGLSAFAEWSRQAPLSQTQISRLKLLSWVGLGLTVATLVQGVIEVTTDLQTAWQITLGAQLLLYVLTTGQVTGQYLPLIQDAHRPLQSLAPCFTLVEHREFESDWLKDWSKDLNRAGSPSKRIARIAGHADALAVRHSALLYGVLSIGLTWELWHGARAAEWRAQFGAEVSRDLKALYDLEALMSIGDFAAERPHYSWATLTGSEEGVPLLKTREIAHPLFNPRGRVPNDFELTGPAQLYLVTGSNMSGKSSFMRALASNVTLALAGAPTCSHSLSCPPLLLATSIQVTDDPSQGWSRFYAEVRRISQVIERAEAGTHLRPVFYLIDEMLSGTNSRERRLASRTIATRLINAPFAAGIITTHDLDLAALTDRFPKQLHLRHFSDHFDGERLSFDYTLHEGVAQTTNALLVLGLEGIKVDDEAGTSSAG